MNTAANIFRDVALKSDAYIDLFIGTLGIYFVAAVAGYSGEKLIYFLIDCVISITVICAISWLLIRKLIYNMISSVDDRQQDASKTKELILRFPFVIGLISVTKMIIVVTIIALSMMIQFDLPLVDTVPMFLVIPMAFFIDFKYHVFQY